MYSWLNHDSILTHYNRKHFDAYYLQMIDTSVIITLLKHLNLCVF